MDQDIVVRINTVLEDLFVNSDSPFTGTDTADPEAMHDTTRLPTRHEQDGPPV
jgi:hypothetical protein